jgi:hypothetical protein
MNVNSEQAKCKNDLPVLRFSTGNMAQSARTHPLSLSGEKFGGN